MKLILTLLIFTTNIIAQTIELDTVSVEESLSFNVKKENFNSQKSVSENLKRLPNTNVIGELSGQPFELVINGVSGFRHNYSIWGIPINFESTSSNDLSLLGNGRYESVDINFDNKFLAKPIGSNVNFTPKIDGKSTVLLKGESNQNFSFLGSYHFPKTKDNFDMRVTIDGNIYKNKYDYFDNNGTLYNTDDDKISTYNNGWSNNFHTTFTEKLTNLKMMQDINFVNRSIPMQKPQTKDPTEKIQSFFVLAKYDKVLSDIFLYSQNFLLKNSAREVIDTNLAVTYNMGYTSHTFGKQTKLSAPFSFGAFFENSELFLNVLPSYDVSQNKDIFTDKTLNNSKRFRLNENLSYTYHLKNFDFSLSGINSNRFDNSYGVYRIYNDTTKIYDDTDNVFDYSADIKSSFGVHKIFIHSSSATRFPSLYELYGDNLFVIPNPELKEEKSKLKAGAGYGLSLGNLILKADFQYNLIENLITSNMYQDRTIKFLNTDKAEITTVSFYTKYSYKRSLLVNFNISYNNAINISEGNLYGYKLPNIHPLTSKLLTNYNYKNFGLSLDTYYYSMVYTTTNNTTYQKPPGDNLSDNGNYGYLPEHIKIDIGFSHLNSYFKTIFEVKNLLDKRVSLSPNYINQGRIFSLTIMREF